MTAAPPPPARQIWQEFHWVFFVNTQALIICIRRLRSCLDRSDWCGAETELDSAAQLLAASGAAMQLAGSFTRRDYDSTVRPSMEPAQVGVDGFSGLMSWDHGMLITEWRKLRPLLADLPDSLAPAHQRFVESYASMADGHVRICSKFVDETAGSLRNADRGALASLRQFKKARLTMIRPDRERLK